MVERVERVEATLSAAVLLTVIYLNVNIRWFRLVWLVEEVDAGIKHFTTNKEDFIK